MYGGMSATAIQVASQPARSASSADPAPRLCPTSAAAAAASTSTPPPTTSAPTTSAPTTEVTAPDAASAATDPGDGLVDDEGIVYATVDLRRCIQPRQMHDIVGHYNRFDVFDLRVNTAVQQPVNLAARHGGESLFPTEGSA